MSESARVLIFAYGNPARGDDALGPELLRLFEEQQDMHPDWKDIELLTDFQLQVEHAVDLEGRDLALFVDASVAAPAPYQFSRLSAERDTSYTSHAMSPAAVLHVYRQVCDQPMPPCFLLSIRGEHFELGQDLSPRAERNLAAAVAFVQNLCRNPSEVAWQGQC